jgi:hypothetical protein
MYDPLTTKIEPELASKIVWFDAFVSNVDRTVRNTNMLIWHKELWLIDHGASLFYHHSWESFERQAANPFKQIKDHVLLKQASDLQAADTFCNTILNKELIESIVSLIPDEWLMDDALNERPTEKRNVYARFLTARLAFSEIFTQEANNARETLI